MTYHDHKENKYKFQIWYYYDRSFRLSTQKSCFFLNDTTNYTNSTYKTSSFFQDCIKITIFYNRYSKQPSATQNNHQLNTFIISYSSLSTPRHTFFILPSFFFFDSRSIISLKIWIHLYLKFKPFTFTHQKNLIDLSRLMFFIVE